MVPDLTSLLPAGRERRLARGETLFRAGDPAIGLVIIHRGMLELQRMSPEGRRLVLHRAGPGASFAEASLFEPRHHCDAVATSPAEITIHTPASLRRAAARDPNLGWRLAAHLAAALVRERARAERLALPHAVERLLDAVHALPAGRDGVRRLDTSWKALAAELGLTHEATYRALARMERQGLLQRIGPGLVRLGAAERAARTL
jgi:CRP/FNR family transcriptional regulator, dissimilatory nitrate respiration regulator